MNASTRRSVSSMATVKLLFLLGMSFIITACTITEPGGRRWTIDPFPGAPEPEGPCVARLVGTFRGCDLWDFNCDGVADLAHCDGEWYFIDPYEPPSPPAGSPPVPSDGGPTDEEEDENLLELYTLLNETLDETGLTEMAQKAGLADIARRMAAPYNFVSLPFKTALAFDFGDWSAAEWMASYGLNVDPGSQVQTESISFVYDTVTRRTEIALPWRSDWHIPNPLEHGIASFEVKVLLPSGGGPAFVILRLGGQDVNILNYILEMDADGVSAHEHEYAGHIYRVEGDAAAGVARLYEDGTLLEEVPLP